MNEIFCRSASVRFALVLTLGVPVCLALGADDASADRVIHRSVTFALDPATLVPDPSGVFVRYLSGTSEPFVPVSPQFGDRLLVHVKFVDPDGRPQHLVLRNLGKGYLSPGGDQLFKAILGLSAGTITGGCTGGWNFVDSLNAANANWASPTSFMSASPILDMAPLHSDFIRTDRSLAFSELQVEFNFNQPLNPPIITNGGGLDRLSLEIHAEGMAILALPLIVLTSGPLHADGTRFDFDGDGHPDAGVIGIALNESQHYQIDVGFPSGAVGTHEFAVMDVLPADFTLDPDAENAATGCRDGSCDGIGVSDFGSALCSVTIKKPAVKGDKVAPTYLVMEGTGVSTSQACLFALFLTTIPVSHDSKQRLVYSPTGCVTADGTAPTTTITRGILLNDGLTLFDTVTQSVLGIIPEPGRPFSTATANPVQLKPVGCP